MKVASIVQFGNSKVEIPKYQTQGSSGVDLAADIMVAIVIRPQHRAIIPTGLATQISHGYEGQVRSRSGLAAKYGIQVLNSPGSIDSDYRGEIKVILYNTGDETFTVHPGDRIAQLVFAPIVYADCDAVAIERGEGGFGSTGV